MKILRFVSLLNIHKTSDNTCRMWFIMLLMMVSVCFTSNTKAEQNIVQPERIEKRFEQPLIPKSQPEVYIRTPKQIPPEKAGQIQFYLTSLEFEGNTVFKQSDFLRFYNNLLSKQSSLNDIYMIADAITAFYRNKGYILCTAIIPPQKITNGVVRIKIIEGFINEVTIEGKMRGRSGLFHQYAKRIKHSKPLNMKVLERYTLLADDLPGASVKSVLHPAKDVPGATDLVITAEHKAGNASIGYDNRGTKSSGPRQATFTLEENSLLRLYEKTSCMYIATDDFRELHYIVFSHDEMLNCEGTKLNFLFNHSRSIPGGDLKDLDIKGENTTFGVGTTHPFIRSRSANLAVNLDFVIKNSKTQIMGVLQSQDNIRVLKAGVTYDFGDKIGGVNLINLGVHRGLDILNASKTGSQNLTRADGHSNFTKITTEMSRNQQLSKHLGLLLAGSSQYAFTPLLSADEFGFGGAQFGRAYNSSEITGDNGVALKAEFQFTNSIHVPALRFIRYYQFYATSEYGKVYGKSDPQTSWAIAASAGGGIRFGITDYLAGYLEIDKSVFRHGNTANMDKNRDPRFFFNIAARF